MSTRAKIFAVPVLAAALLAGCSANDSPEPAPAASACTEEGTRAARRTVEVEVLAVWADLAHLKHGEEPLGYLLLGDEVRLSGYVRCGSGPWNGKVSARVRERAHADSPLSANPVSGYVVDPGSTLS